MNGGGSICAGPGADATPIDRAVVDSYWECDKLGGPNASDQCQAAYDVFLEATGCGTGTACRNEARERDPLVSARDEQCGSVSLLEPNGPAECERTRVAIPCPSWPPLSVEPAPANELGEGDTAAVQPAGVDPAEAPRPGLQAHPPGTLGAHSSASAPCATNGAADCNQGVPVHSPQPTDV